MSKLPWYEDPVYTKMCEASEDIQRLWKPSYGDFFVAKRKYTQIDGDDWPEHIVEVGTVNILHDSWRINDQPTDPREVGIWLPHLIQLYDMVDTAWSWCSDDNKASVHVIFTEDELPRWKPDVMADRICLFGKFAGSRFTTINQLLIAFVMKENYKKKWGEEKWEFI